MIDGIIAGTGDSRSLYGSLPATYAEFKAAVEAGTQYVDVSYHSAGWQQEPTFLNKANLLTDAVAALFGLSPNATVNDAFNAASGLISTAQTTANGRARIATGSYTGTGTYDLANPNTLTFPFSPKIVFIRKAPDGVTNGYAGNNDAFAVFSQTASNVSEDYSATSSGNAGGFAGTLYIPSNTYPFAYRLKGKLVSKTLTWCNLESAKYQANGSGEVYYWTAIS